MTISLVIMPSIPVKHDLIVGGGWGPSLGKGGGVGGWERGTKNKAATYNDGSRGKEMYLEEIVQFQQYF